MNEIDKIDKIQSALSKILGSHNREASIFFMGSAAKLKGNLFIPGLSDIDLLVVPRCSTLTEYEKWLTITTNLYRELNRSSDQLYDVFILTDRIASLHFACLSTLAGPLLGDSARVDEKYNATVLTKVHINPKVRIAMYEAMLRRMVYKAKHLLPVSDTGQGRKTVKFIRKLIKAAICSTADEGELDLIEKKLLGISDLSSLNKLANAKLSVSSTFNEVFQSVLNGDRVDDWPACNIWPFIFSFLTHLQPHFWALLHC